MTKYGKIYPVSFGFGWGIISGIGWMLFVWAGARWGFGLPVINLMSHVYYGVEATLKGGLWALWWGFLHLFVLALLAAMVYNCCSKCFCPAGECE